MKHDFGMEFGVKSNYNPSAHWGKPVLSAASKLISAKPGSICQSEIKSDGKRWFEFESLISSEKGTIKIDAPTGVIEFVEFPSLNLGLCRISQLTEQDCIVGFYDSEALEVVKNGVPEGYQNNPVIRSLRLDNMGIVPDVEKTLHVEELKLAEPNLEQMFYEEETINKAR